MSLKEGHLVLAIRDWLCSETACLLERVGAVYENNGRPLWPSKPQGLRQIVEVDLYHGTLGVCVTDRSKMYITLRLENSNLKAVSRAGTELAL